MPHSLQGVKNICSRCRICAELKPNFFKKEEETLISANQTRHRLSICFKVPIKGRNSYILIAIGQYSRLPFAFACKSMNTETFITCLNPLFSLFGLPGFICGERRPSFMSRELKNYLYSWGMATSRKTQYHRTGNSQ